MWIDSYEVTDKRNGNYCCTAHVEKGASESRVIRRACQILNNSVPAEQLEVKFIGSYDNTNYTSQGHTLHVRREG